MARIKEISVQLAECSEKTGYYYELLVNRVEACRYETGMTYQEAADYICSLAEKGEL